jgi:hypothetical protein
LVGSPDRTLRGGLFARTASGEPLARVKNTPYSGKSGTTPVPAFAGRDGIQPWIEGSIPPGEVFVPVDDNNPKDAVIPSR